MYYVGGLSSAGLAAGGYAVTYQSIAYSSATRVIALSLQSAGTTTAMSSVGAILTGAATTGAGVLVATTNDQPDTSASSESLQKAAKSTADDDDNGNPPPHCSTALGEYLLTPRAILAIVKAWNVGTYDPPGTNCANWLDKVHDVCEQYEIPAKQQAPCALHHMRADCKEAAHAAGCYNMTWDEFAVWLRQYDNEGRESTDGKTRKTAKTAKVSAEKSKLRSLSR
ncbi:hypothetical protein BDM02DRAFT_3124333 [Thelephora ganbajun]|uniref:Uncharacterized protein n=1 Tax=Thelephora ganbajun TaxID=370292 RepID=A0ACB6YZF9_THEGA|nr:hypothetical protein BDM02DRAFT_3124333 [Thelephora ganbajun]